MRATVIGAQGLVGAAFVRLLRTQSEVELVEVTRQNYRQFTGTPSDVVIEAACNSKKFMAEQEPLAEFDSSVAHRLRTLIDFPARLDEEFLARGIPADGLDVEGLAEDMQGVRVGVQRSGDRRGDHALRVMVEDGVFDDAFACAGFSQDEA